MNESIERSVRLNATEERGSTVDIALQGDDGFTVHFYKAQPMRPSAVKTNRMLTLFETPEFLPLDDREVDPVVEEVEVWVETGVELKVTP